MEKRNMGIDILRILSMIGIVMLHFLNLGGILNELVPLSLNAFILRYVYVISFTSVNIFAIITGYLSVNKMTIKYGRIIELLVSLCFWSICITLFLVYIGKISGGREIIISLFPPLAGRYWYIVSYVFVYFMIPYMNKFINMLDLKTYNKFLITLLILLSIIPTFGNTDFFRANTGSSPLWLMACYFIGAWLKKNPITCLCRTKAKIVLFITSLFVWSWYNLVEYGTTKIIGEPRFFLFWCRSYYSPVIVIMAVSIVIWFSNIQIEPNKRIRSFLSKISNSMFGVYIIHAHAMLWDKVIEPFITKHANKFAMANTIICIINVIVGVGAIVIITCILENIRVKVFKIFKINNILDKVARLLDSKIAL